MEHIGDALKRVANAPKLAARFEQLRTEILAHKRVQQFLEAHADQLTTEIVDRSIGKLYEYTNASHDCERCSNLEGCTNIMQGFEPKLVLTHRAIDIDYIKCARKIVEDERRNVAKMVDSMYMPKDVMEAQLSSIDIYYDDSRVKVVRAKKTFFDFSCCFN